MPNPKNDHIEVYEDKAGDWRWRRVDGTNGKIVSESGEGYDDRLYCVEAAEAYCPGVPFLSPDSESA